MNGVFWTEGCLQESGGQLVPIDEKYRFTAGGRVMRRKWTVLGFASFGLLIMGVSALATLQSSGGASRSGQSERSIIATHDFDVEILVNGRPLQEYQARGRSYVEALEGQEYEVRLHNRSPYRVAVALSVDGLNTIDARRTTAWNASKWVVEAYGTASIGGWQMSSQRARRFYFTSEQDSYGSKLGQTSNLGLVSAVVFRERRPIAITPPPQPRPYYEEDGIRKDKPKSSSGASADSAAPMRRGEVAPGRDDEYAATGIGRSVQNDVRWVKMDLEPRAAAEVAIRYEYYPTLVRLGILPRHYPERDSLRRRESASGFEDRRFSPEP